jgi:hypothetical protein
MPLTVGAYLQNREYCDKTCKADRTMYQRAPGATAKKKSLDRVLVRWSFLFILAVLEPWRGSLTGIVNPVVEGNRSQQQLQ